jgi:hypothetical protein
VSPVETQPPSAAHSATIPQPRMTSPIPEVIQAQLLGEINRSCAEIRLLKRTKGLL